MLHSDTQFSKYSSGESTQLKHSITYTLKDPSTVPQPIVSNSNPMSMLEEPSFSSKLVSLLTLCSTVEKLAYFSMYDVMVMLIALFQPFIQTASYN